MRQNIGAIALHTETTRRKVKLFGGRGHNVRRKKSTARTAIKTVVITMLVMTVLYLVGVYSDIPPIARLRTMYIETAMSTMRHQWLATAFFPQSVIDEVMGRMSEAQKEQIGMESSWGNGTHASKDPTAPTDDLSASEEERAFYELFWEIDRDSMQAYLDQHPEALADGWENLSINEAGLDDDGTSIQTVQGEQVLAIDVPNQVLLIRVKEMMFRGVLAVAKDPSRLSLQAAENLGSIGQFSGDICEDNNGILAITASGFIDEGGTALGGLLAGYAMCDGVAYGTHMGYGYKRIELREDDRLYIVDAQSAVHADTTDAAEFWPAMIIDGVRVVDENSGWDALNPRVSIGQSDRGEILMMVTEGRLATSVGATVTECADILLEHGCMQALNMDGGTSAMMYYDGEYVTRCSNQALPYGRQVPDAWVYARAS